MEAVKAKFGLNEITAARAYTDFYQDIPKEAYDSLMTGSANMTPFHKMVLDCYKNGITDENGLRTAGEIWSNASRDAQQYLVTSAKEDADYVSNSKEALNKFFADFKKMRHHTEKGFSNAGLEVLYEDDNVRITCTKSYHASKANYGASHWCTASGVDGEGNGFSYFQAHTTNGVLIQLVDKNNIENSFQIEYGYFGRDMHGNRYEFQCIFNWYDEEVTLQDGIDMLASYGVDFGKVWNENIGPNMDRLVAETSKNVDEEEEFIYRQLRIKIGKVIKKANTMFSTPDFREQLNKKLVRMRENQALFEGPQKEWPFECTLLQDFSAQVKPPTTVVSVTFCGTNTSEMEVVNFGFDDDDDRITNNVTRITIVGDDGRIIASFPGQPNPDFWLTNNTFMVEKSLVFDKIVDARNGKVLVDKSEADDWDYVFDNGREIHRDIVIKYKNGRKAILNTVSCQIAG